MPKKPEETRPPRVGGSKVPEAVKRESAARLKTLLEKSKLSQADLARLTGIKPPNINKLLKGERAPNARQIPVLAKALGVDPKELLPQVDEAENALGSLRVVYDKDVPEQLHPALEAFFQDVPVTDPERKSMIGVFRESRFRGKTGQAITRQSLEALLTTIRQLRAEAEREDE